MKRVGIAPINLADVPVEQTPIGTTRQEVMHDRAIGSRMILMTMPPGYRSRNADRGFEYHTCHEEIFNLNGLLHFGHWYDYPALGYLNHPPYWLHPADQNTGTGVRLLIKLNKPVDFVFEPIPDGWDGVEWTSADAPGPIPGRAVSSQNIDVLEWQPAELADGSPAGFDAKTLYHGPDGWTTWLMRVPGGWHGEGRAARLAGGDEMVLLSGGLTLELAEGPARLTEGGYFCDPENIVTAGEGTYSETGCIAIRWTKGADFLRLPPILF